jgi:hypothetical protein
MQIWRMCQPVGIEGLKFKRIVQSLAVSKAFGVKLLRPRYSLTLTTSHSDRFNPSFQIISYNSRT